MQFPVFVGPCSCRQCVGHAARWLDTVALIGFHTELCPSWETSWAALNCDESPSARRHLTSAVLLQPARSSTCWLWGKHGSQVRVAYSSRRPGQALFTSIRKPSWQRPAFWCGASPSWRDQVFVFGLRVLLAQTPGFPVNLKERSAHFSASRLWSDSQTSLRLPAHLIHSEAALYVSRTERWSFKWAGRSCCSLHCAM